MHTRMGERKAGSGTTQRRFPNVLVPTEHMPALMLVESQSARSHLLSVSRPVAAMCFSSERPALICACHTFLPLSPVSLLLRLLPDSQTPGTLILVSHSPPTDRLELLQTVYWHDIQVKVVKPIPLEALCQEKVLWYAGCMGWVGF